MARGEPFSARLLHWYDANRRDLPWRRTQDPWAIWVSEIMLQQTRVEAVRGHFERFLLRYPTAASFAGADDDELMLAWRGLGYYRRARLLREGARRVTADHGGRVPGDAAQLGDLPGIGAYTLGAIGSIAFGLPIAAVDGNVERVLARHLDLHAELGSARAKAAIGEAAAARLDQRRPGDFNQAMMELGATVCTPTSPRCEACPVRADCLGRRRGTATMLPKRKAKAPPALVEARVAVVPAEGGVLALRIPADEPNGGQWELPGPGALRSADPADFESLTLARCGARLGLESALCSVRHAITRHKITVHAHLGRLRSRSRGTLFAARPDDPAAPWTTISRKVFAAADGLLGPTDA